MNEFKDNILKPVSIYLSSSGRTGGNCEDPTFNLNNVYNLENVRFVVINSIEIPNIFPNVRTGINDTLRILDVTNNQNLDVTLSQGFYTANDLTTKLKSELDSKSTHGVTFTVAVDQKTAKMNITASSGSIQLKYANSKMARILGFTSDSASAGSITGDAGVNLIPTTCIYVCSDSFGNCSLSWRGLTNVVAKIPVNVYYGGIIGYKSNDIKMDLIPVHNLTMNSFSFKLYYDDFSPVNMNGYNWSISVTVFKP